MMRYQAILKREQERIAKVLASETGKVFDDAMGDVWRGIEVVEQAMNAPSMMRAQWPSPVAARRKGSPRGDGAYARPVCSYMTSAAPSSAAIVAADQ